MFKSHMFGMTVIQAQIISNYNIEDMLFSMFIP